MNVWLLEPRDPLIIRDGRPFGPNPGARANSLPFPLPSTLAGAIRSRAGHDEAGAFDRTRIPELLAYRIAGPLLAEYSGEGSPHYMAPAPADALLLPLPGDADDRRFLAPLSLRSAAQCGWPEATKLQPVGPTRPSPLKPLAGAPRFWYWSALEDWLRTSSDGPVSLHSLGHSGATPEVRMHVRIDAQTQSAEEGMLFQTSGLEFTHVKSPSAPADGTIASATRLVLACATDAPLHEGVGSVGGERRLVHWQLTAGALPPCPQDIYKQIVTTGCCRLLLLTPACFAQGFLPQWLLTMTPGVTVEVVGAALGRFQGASGWDLQAGHAKAARKLAPAGAVYFLRLHGQSDAVAQFVRSTWMGCISDDAQSRRDGFGLAVVGNWNGQLQSMEVT